MRTTTGPCLACALMLVAALPVAADELPLLP